jgi:hypothetical protein
VAYSLAYVCVAVKSSGDKSIVGVCCIHVAMVLHRLTKSTNDTHGSIIISEHSSIHWYFKHAYCIPTKGSYTSRAILIIHKDSRMPCNIPVLDELYEVLVAVIVYYSCAVQLAKHRLTNCSNSADCAEARYCHQEVV